MNVYVYRAALLCEDCGKLFLENIPRWPGTYKSTFEDSEVYPQGPYPHGGGEADCPQSCDHCHVFLENPLTGDGDTYVREAAEFDAPDWVAK